jgi:general secretion pathway protein A
MYTDFYGLTGEPFLLTPDHRFFFESTVHAQAMAHLSYGLSRREGFIVITGDVGAGKTTLVKRLLATIDAHEIIAAHVVTTMLSGADLLRMVCGAFGIRDVPLEKGPILLRLQNFFETVHREGKHALLIVDEAQNLPAAALEELRMLSNFQIESSSPFQSFLIGQPQFRDIMAHRDLEQFRQRVIAAFHLGPMSLDECAEYLPHRLKRVGWKNDPYFEPAAIDAVFRHTEGIPRRINTLCNRLLLFGFLDNLHKFTADDVDRVAADLAVENGARNVAGTSPPRSFSQPFGFSDLAVDLGSDAEERISALEKRLNRQDKALRQIASAFFDLMGLGQSDRKE